MSRHTTARVAMVIFFLVAAAAAMRAEVERWWPTCSSGPVNPDDCLAIQDHRYDYLMPSAPWTPTGQSAGWSGVAFAALGAALLLVAVLALTVADDRRRRRMAVVIGVGLVFGPLGTAVGQFVAQGSGQPSTSAVVGTAQFVWSTGTLVLLPLLARSVSAHVRTRWRWFAFALWMTTPAAGFFLMGAGPYDTAPWNGVGTVIMLVIAAAVGWGITSPRPSPTVGESVPKPEQLALA